MKRTLLVFYSRSGTTRKAAEALAQACGADLEELHEPDPRRRDGVAGYLRCLADVVAGRRVALAPTVHDPADYALTIVGTPVWAGHISAPLRSYLAARHGRMRRVAAFCTMGGAGGARVLDAIAACVQQPLVARLTLDQRQMRGDAYRPLTTGFAEALLLQGGAVPADPSRPAAA